MQSLVSSRFKNKIKGRGFPLPFFVGFNFLKPKGGRSCDLLFLYGISKLLVGSNKLSYRRKLRIVIDSIKLFRNI